MKRSVLFLGVLSAFLLASCAAPTPIVQTVEVERVVTEQVEVEREVAVTPTPIGGQLTLYACLFDPDKLQVLFETFEALYGVEVTCLDMSSGEALERIRAEKDNPQGDVLFGTTNLSHVNLAADGLLEPYKGAGWNQLPHRELSGLSQRDQRFRSCPPGRRLDTTPVVWWLRFCHAYTRYVPRRSPHAALRSASTIDHGRANASR